MSYITPPTFKDNVEQLLSATDYSILENNVAVVDGFSFRDLPVFQSSASLDTWCPGYYPSKRQQFPIWIGYLRYRSGMTTLTVQGASNGFGGATVQIVVNGAQLDAFTPGATFTRPIQIDNRGYTNGQLLSIRVRVQWPSSNGGSTTGRIVIYDVYGSPAPKPSTSYPGTSSFSSTTINAASLNQLTKATAWVWERLGLVSYPLSLGHYYNLGPFRDNEHRPMLHGAVFKGFSTDILRVGLQIINHTSPSMQVDFYLNNVASPVYSTPAFGIGTTNLWIPLSLSSYAAGAPIEMSIYGTILDAGPRPAWKFSRWTSTVLAAEPIGSGHAVGTLPAPPVGYQDTTPAQMASKLNTLCSILNAAQSRIENAPYLFDRIRATRRPFSQEDTIDARSGLPFARAKLRATRRGRRLLVSGKNVSLGYGQIIVPSDDPAKTYDDHTFLRNETLIEADKQDTKIFYLDQYADLTPGTSYALLGDVSYAEELLD